MADVNQALRNRSAIETLCEAIMGEDRSFVKIDGDLSFFSFRNKKRGKCFEDFNSSLSADMENIKTPMCGSLEHPWRPVDFYVNVKVFAQEPYRGWISHFDGQAPDVCRSFSATLKDCIALDRDAAFTVNKPSEVCQLRAIHAGMVARTSNKTQAESSAWTVTKGGN